MPHARKVLVMLDLRYRLLHLILDRTFIYFLIVAAVVSLASKIGWSFVLVGPSILSPELVRKLRF